jgi:hypothetical protein
VPITTLSRPGADNLGTDKLALFKAQFTGEVLKAFQNATVMGGRHLVRTISHGKSAEFPLLGEAFTKYHVPGESLFTDGDYLSNFRHGNRYIYIDGFLTSNFFLYDLDEAMNHWDVRSHYAESCGKQLALQWDKNVLRKVIQAARTNTSPITGGPVGSTINAGPTVASTAAVLADAIIKAGTILDEKNVPHDERYCIVLPATYELLIKEYDLINKDWGGDGSLSQGRIRALNGIEIIKSNQLPNTNEGTTQDPADRNGYFADYSTTVAAVFHKAAAGTVKLKDLQVESERDFDHIGHKWSARYAVGHGVVNPQCSVEISANP